MYNPYTVLLSLQFICLPFRSTQSYGTFACGDDIATLFSPVCFYLLASISTLILCTMIENLPKRNGTLHATRYKAQQHIISFTRHDFTFFETLPMPMVLDLSLPIVSSLPLFVALSALSYALPCNAQFAYQ
jgi:hypothetical protein